MANLFDSFPKPDISKLELSKFEKKVKKLEPEKIKVEKRPSKVASGDVPPFKDASLRKQLFPNNPPAKPKRLGIGSRGVKEEIVKLKCKAKEPKG